MAAKHVVVLFDYEDRRVVGGVEVEFLGRQLVVWALDREDCGFDYTTLVNVNPTTLLLLARQTTGPPQRIEWFGRYPYGSSASRSA